MSTDCGTAKPSQTTQAHNYPIVSIIIPCRNEQAFIGGCLDSILENDFPKEQLEILVVDGMSEDGTRELLNAYCREYAFLFVLDNPKRVTPAALNMGIQHTRGPIVMRMDAHATIEMMEVLKDNPITWLAVFSKCVYAAEKNAELGNTSDPDVRRYALNYLKVARSSYLQGSAAELASERVSKGIEAFSAYAMKSGAKLGGNLRGRHPSNPVAARAAAVARFCMWGFPYQNFVWRAVRQAMLGFLVPDPKLNKSDWKLLLTALLLYPLSADAATVHRWLKHLNERFDGETLGGMSVVIWHRQLEESGIAVYKDIAWAVVSVAEECDSFWTC